MIPTLDAAMPSLTAAQMAEVDRVMVDELGITLPQMMENAGRHLAWLARTRWSPVAVTVLAGTGGNGGGALVAARHLHNRGLSVSITVTDERRVTAVTGAQLDIARRLGIPIVDRPPVGDVVVDGLIGYSLTGDPRGRAAELIEWANDTGSSPVLSLDVPSGLDATTGRVGTPCIRAAATLTLALPKAGLGLAPEVVGEAYLADISVPPMAYLGLGIEYADPFTDGPVVALASPSP
jgi:NAD(P)H-hydrate epimerase